MEHDLTVSEAGYRWESTKDLGRGPILVVLRPWPNKVLKLSEEPALFRNFAALAPEPEAMLRFANTYGHLGDFIWLAGSEFDPAQASGANPLNDTLVRRTGLSPDRLGLERAETMSLWISQIRAMSAACDLWEQLAEGKVDPNLTSEVTSVIDSGCRERVEWQLGYDKVKRETSWSHTPVDLLGALWLEFAEAVIGNKRTRQCSVCDRWFLVAAGIGRSHKEHCSLSCRQKAYRKRKQDAIELHGKGMSAKEIATKLGSDIETVTGWLKGQQGGESTDGGDPNGRPIDV
jgi:hypothetical protein